jgi:hypothetical protein
LEVDRQPLGPGTPSERAGRLARKLRDKANGGQLLNRPNPVLVVASWHEWGVRAANLESRSSPEFDSPFRAAIWGKEGEVVTGVVEFEGALHEKGVLGSAGVLAVPGDAAALLWLFQVGRPILAKRAPGSLPSLDATAEGLLIDAFSPIVLAPA